MEYVIFPLLMAAIIAAMVMESRRRTQEMRDARRRNRNRHR